MRRASPVEQTADYRKARRAAEELARFLRKPLEELSPGRRTVRDPDHLAEPLRDRVRRVREGTWFLPQQPISMRTRADRTAEGVILTIPGPGLGPARLLPHRRRPSSLQGSPRSFSCRRRLSSNFFFAAFILLFAVLLPVLTALLSVVRSVRRETRVTATRALLRVEERRNGKKTTVEIPADELEELEFVDRRGALKGIELPGGTGLKDVGDTGTPRFSGGRPMPKILLALMRMAPSQGITARSDKMALTFGAGLPEEELAYLYALILKTVTD